MVTKDHIMGCDFFKCLIQKHWIIDSVTLRFVKHFLMSRGVKKSVQDDRNSITYFIDHFLLSHLNVKFFLSSFHMILDLLPGGTGIRVLINFMKPHTF